MLIDHNVQLKLRVLDIGNNFIQDIENVSHLTAMEEFWVRAPLTWLAWQVLTRGQANNNMVKDFAQVEASLSGMKDLETVYFEGNPIQKDLGVNYRRKIMLALPQVGQIDAT